MLKIALNLDILTKILFDKEINVLPVSFLLLTH